MKIRREKESDYENIYSLVKEAFASVSYSDGNEQKLVSNLRQGDSYIPELSLVMEIDGKIVGHILFAKAFVGEYPVLPLAPLSVLPDYQRQGIGSMLVKKSHKIAVALGFDYSVVLGSNKYYSRFGYVSATKFGIIPPFDVPSENFMAIKLKENTIVISELMKYAMEFGID